MAKLANVLFSRKRKRESTTEIIVKEQNNNNNSHPSDETVITTDLLSDISPHSDDDLTQRKVKFSTVQIHEHSLVLGDNPAVSRGVPLTLAWESLDTTVYTVDEFEARRQPKRRRNSLPLAYTPQQREAIAKHSGSSKTAIQYVGVRVKEIQQLREESELDGKGVWERIVKVPGIICRFRL